jgi:hypothetical protein
MEGSGYFHALATLLPRQVTPVLNGQDVGPQVKDVLENK